MPRNNRENRSVRDYESEHTLRKALIAMESDGYEGRNPSETTTTTTTTTPAATAAAVHEQQNHATAAGAAATAADGGGGDATSNSGGVAVGTTSEAAASRRHEEDEKMAAAVASSTTSNNNSNSGKADLDWVLPGLDPDTTEVQSMKEELQRLLVLKSYLILDSEREATFERLTGFASRIFKVPIALVSVVDLGRQWFMSNRGLGDVRETPRRHAFCAHAILSKEGMLVVPDATQDDRFKDNPLVTGPPSIRFYAGAPMISPEGYKLGTFCIIDDKVRPQGLTEDEQASLRDLADMAVKEMVDRHYKTKKQQSPAQLIAYTAHDLMTPLSGVQLSLSLLKEDEEVKSRLGYHQLELLSTAANCSDLMIRICQTAIDSLRQENIASNKAAAAAAAAAAESMQQLGGGGIGGAAADALPMTEMSELVNSLAMVMEPIPKLAPLIITLDERVPPVICCDDLKLFRSALNLISNALPRTEIGAVHLRIFPNGGGRDGGGRNDGDYHPTKLMFECSDTGPDIAVEQYQHLYKPSRVEEDGGLCLGLSSVATLINSLAGEYGFRPLGEACAAPTAAPAVSSSNSSSGEGNGGAELPLVPPPQQRTNTGSVFWFSVPLVVPDHIISKEEGLIMPAVASLHKKTDSLKNSSGSLLERSLSSQRLAGGSCSAGGGSNTSVSSTGKRRIPIIVGSVFDSGALQNSCFRDILPTNEGPRHGSGLGAGLRSLSDLAAVAREGRELGDRKMPAVPRNMSGLVSTSATAAVAAAAAAAAAAASNNIPTTTRKRRALVIEDSLVVRKSLSRALDKMGFDVTQAVNGLEGLNRLKENLFDLVLCDFLMPVMDGMDCVKQYRDWEREHRIGYHQYIVGISAHATSNDGDQGIKAGMDIFKQKPISVRLLMEFQETDGFDRCSTMIDDMEPHSAAMVVSREPADARNLVGRARPAEATGSMINDDPSRPVKRHKHDDESSGQMQKAATPVCLMATDKPAKDSNEVLMNLEKNGWKIVIANDGQDALRLLQIRNWDAILIDDDIPLLAGSPCMEKFRSWEAENRVNRQRRAFLICSNVEIPSPFDKCSIVQPPHGFDGVLGKPVKWKDLNKMLQRNRERSFDIVIRK